MLALDQRPAARDEPQAKCSSVSRVTAKKSSLRRTVYDLRKAEERAHILEGLKIAVENIDEVVGLIRRVARSGRSRRSELMAQIQIHRDPGQGDSRDASAAPDWPRARQDHRRVQDDVRPSLRTCKLILADEKKVLRDHFGRACVEFKKSSATSAAPSSSMNKRT